MFRSEAKNKTVNFEFAFKEIGIEHVMLKFSGLNPLDIVY